MRKTKSEGKTVGISQSVRKVANFAMDFDVFVRQMNSALWFVNFAMPISQCQIGNANFAMPNGCQLIANCLPKFLFCFFSSDFQYMLQNLHKTSKIKARKIA